jgi:Fic family protein
MTATIVDELRLSEKSTLLARAARLQGELATLCRVPSAPGFLEELERKLLRESIHASAAIAGNPMRADEVLALLERGADAPETPAGPTVARARREVANLALAYAPLPVGREGESVFGVSEGFVKKVHTVLVQGTGSGAPGATGMAGAPGEYAAAEGGIQAEMLRLVTWINGADPLLGNPILRAALCHYGLLSLRPFAAGSGRTARFFETSILVVAGLRFVPYLLPVHYHANIDRYLGFFLGTGLKTGPGQGPDRGPGAAEFVEFVLEGVRNGLDDVRERVLEPMRTLVLKAHFDSLREERRIKDRAHCLLHLLLDHAEPFQLKDLFLRQPFKLLYDRVTEHTARRDLLRLMELGLLAKDGTSYTFQRRALG